MKGKEWTIEEKEDIIRSLKPYLEAGLSRNKACKSVGLAAQTLSDWVKADESLRIRLQGYENVVNIKAMANVVDAIEAENQNEKDTKKETSKWWLERRMKTEFSTRVEQTGADGEGHPVMVQFIDAKPTDNSNTD